MSSKKKLLPNLLLASALISAPVLLSHSDSPLANIAWAEKGGNGGGNSGGNAGGNGGNRGGEKGSAGKSAGKQGLGQQNKADKQAQKAERQAAKAEAKQGKLGKDPKSISSTLGRLNAAHASATARANASPTSAVGMIASYEAAVRDTQDLAAAGASEDELAAAAEVEAEALAAAANKSIEADYDTVSQAVNDMLGLSSEPNTDTSAEEDSTSDTNETL